MDYRKLFKDHFNIQATTCFNSLRLKFYFCAFARNSNVSRKGAKPQISRRKELLGCLMCSFLLIPACLIPLSQSAQALALSSSASQQSGALAIVNNQTITLDDVDPQIQQLVANLDKEIREARQRVLQEQVNELLFETEAKARRISVDRLLDLEVGRRVTEPTAEEIRAIYQANRAQFGAADLNAARPQITAYLRQQAEDKLVADLAARLRKRHAVSMGTDINSPRLAAGTVLATVAGRTLTAGPILERLKPVIYDLRMRAYEATKAGVEQMIYNLLILEEARRQNVGPEVIIRTEITNKLLAPTDEEIAKFYEENKSRISMDFASARAPIAQHLGQEQQFKLELALNDRLRAKASVRMMIVEPEMPVLAVSTDGEPSRGEASAPVTVVVFTDFQCPSCAANHPLIEEALKTYGKSVRLVIRDFPLAMHADARKAAEAANAAHAQGKFFEYIEVLFKNQKALDVASFKEVRD